VAGIGDSTLFPNSKMAAAAQIGQSRFRSGEITSMQPSGGAAPVGTTWSSSDKAANVALSGDLLTATSNLSTSIGSVRATKSVTTGKVYFELKATFTTVAGGWHGVTTATKSLTAGTSSGSATVDISQGSKVEVNGVHQTFLDGFGTFVNNDVLCVALDLSNQKVWFRRNGGQWNAGGTANPATNVGGFDVSMLFTGVAAFPIAQFSNTTAVNNITFNGGTIAFAQTIPSGFVAWG
jgi:hypothetical protein